MTNARILAMASLCGLWLGLGPAQAAGPAAPEDLSFGARADWEGPDGGKSFEGLVRSVKATAGRGGEPVLGRPDAARRHRFRLNATLYTTSQMLAQAAVLSVAFDMEPVADVNGERRISNVEFSLELQAGGNIPMPAYMMRTLGPDYPSDFFPPDSNWWRGGHAYSKESFWKDETYFYIEIPANIELRAAGTVLDPAIKRLEDDRSFGSKALIKLYPYCTRDLKTCRPGTLTGISYSKWGFGWVDTVYPDFRLLSEETFSLAP